MLRIKEGIEIVDKNGAPRIRLSIDEFGEDEFPKIDILDETGFPRISIGMEQGFGKIALYSADGNFTVGIGEDGTGGGVEAAANKDPYARVHLIPMDGEYRLIISRKDNRQIHSDGSISVATAEFPDDRKCKRDSE